MKVNIQSFNGITPLWHSIATWAAFLAFPVGGALALGVCGLVLRLCGVELVEPQFAALLGGAIGVIIFACRWCAIESSLNLSWKRETAARLGLLESDDSLVHTLMVYTRLGPLGHVGLLEVASDALIFRHDDGIVSIPYSSIQSIGPDGYYSRWWICLYLTDKSCRWLQVLEGPTSWGGWKPRFVLAERIHWQRLEYHLRTHYSRLDGWTVSNVPELLEQSLTATSGPPNDDTSPDYIGIIVAAALSLLLRDRGWVSSSHGLSMGNVSVDPFELTERLTKHKLTATEWRDIWATTGVQNVNLGEFSLAFIQKQQRS